MKKYLFYVKLVKYLGFDGFTDLDLKIVTFVYQRIIMVTTYLLKCGFCKKSFIMNAPLVSTHPKVMTNMLN